VLSRWSGPPVSALGQLGDLGCLFLELRFIVEVEYGVIAADRFLGGGSISPAPRSAA
jgi:hypothetical protein